MFYVVIIQAVFTQVPTAAFPQRNQSFVFPGVNSFECDDSWRDLTNKGKITLAKNIYVKDKSGKRVRLGIPTGLGASNVNLGGFGPNPPLFLIGDQVTLTVGYRYQTPQKVNTLQTSVWFSGFVTQVQSKLRFELELQDAMFKLKQIPAPNKVFKGSQYTLESMLTEMLQGTPYTVRKGVDTSIGDFRVQAETVAQVLARLQKDFHFPSYFRGNELRVGFPTYVPQDAIDDGQKVFRFQNNIITDDLVYKRKDDIVLSAVAYSINSSQLTATTKSGKTKTQKQRLEVFVGYQNGKAISIITPHGQKANYPPNVEGERRTFFFVGITDPKLLIQLAQGQLDKYHYDGFRGKFKTFGIPFVRVGDYVDILDRVLTERCGRYVVKSVKYSGGENGLRQEIEVDFLITRLDVNGKSIS